jgi:hypothetical protein
VGIFRKFQKASRVYRSDTYKETMDSVERLAAASYGLITSKSPQEQADLLARVTELSEKISAAMENEVPLVISLTLLTVARVHDQTMQHQAKR